MKHSILYSAIMATMAVGLAACSSDSDVAGIGGSGITSSGTITGFGSIFVNGVEFETSSSTFSVDGSPGTESDLATGMRVIVNGTVNADGVTGTANSVTFDDQLQGPISNVGDIDLDGTSRTITILGTTVKLNNTSTIFDISGALPGSFDWDNFGVGNVGNNVEISGFVNSTGELQATRIELKEAPFVPNSSIVELKGAIAGLVGTSFTVNGIDVNASSAAIDDLPSGLAENALVEVKGTCSDTNCNPINATRVEGQSPDFDDNDDVEIEGLITRYVSDSDFDVDGFPVDASGSGVERIPPTLTLAVDKEVEVEGTVVGGTLIATKIKDEGGEIKIAATVVAANSAAGTFDLVPVTGEPAVTVMIDTSTQIEDEVGNFNSAALLDNLSLGTDYLVVEGYDDGTGMNTIIASEVERELPDDVIMQGVITEFSLGSGSDSVTVLGVTIPFSTNTDFQRADDTDYPDAAAFFADVTLNSTLVKVKDKLSGGGNTPVGTADEIEIELP